MTLSRDDEDILQIILINACMNFVYMMDCLDRYWHDISGPPRDWEEVSEYT